MDRFILSEAIKYIDTLPKGEIRYFWHVPNNQTDNTFIRLCSDMKILIVTDSEIKAKFMAKVLNVLSTDNDIDFSLLDDDSDLLYDFLFWTSEKYENEKNLGRKISENIGEYIGEIVEVLANKSLDATCFSCPITEIPKNYVQYVVADNKPDTDQFYHKNVICEADLSIADIWAWKRFCLLQDEDCTIPIDSAEIRNTEKYDEINMNLAKEEAIAKGINPGITWQSVTKK